MAEKTTETLTREQLNALVEQLEQKLTQLPEKEKERVRGIIAQIRAALAQPGNEFKVTL